MVTLIKPTLKAAGQSAVAGGQEAKTIAGIGTYFLSKARRPK
ncbi:MAG: hypothetical protein V1722_00355 [Candidatus Micrarchaeota archaeon]